MDRYGDNIIDIRPLKMKKDYETTLNEASKLMSALPNTPEGDLLDVLTACWILWSQAL